MRVEIFILLGVTFFTYFNQTSLETIVIPFTEIMFGWSELENSILFCIGGIVIIASYVVIRVLSKRLTDRWIMLIGLATIATGLIIACACLFTRFFHLILSYAHLKYRNIFIY
jgi:Na+/melibiose symporter-like transporter